MESLKLNHIGVAVKNDKATAALLESMGYRDGGLRYDANQNVNVRFMYSDDSPAIELLSKPDVVPDFSKAEMLDNKRLVGISGGVEAASPIDKIIEKNGTCVYHLCYETHDIETDINRFREQHYIPVGAKKPSLIDGKEVIFLYHPDNVMIELLDMSGR